MSVDLHGEHDHMEEEKHGELQVVMAMSLYPIGITHPYPYLSEFFVHMKKPITMCRCSFVMLSISMLVAGYLRIVHT